MADEDDVRSPAEHRLIEIEESTNPAERAAWKTLRFLRGRGGFSDWFDYIDDETQVEIIDGMVAAVAAEMSL